MPCAQGSLLAVLGGRGAYAVPGIKPVCKACALHLPLNSPSLPPSPLSSPLFPSLSSSLPSFFSLSPFALLSPPFSVSSLPLVLQQA